MLWAAFGYNGKSELARVPTKCDSVGYQNILKANLVKQGCIMSGRGWIFQQDNAPIHSSKSTKEYLASRNIRTLDWPARSPDLNPMENLWAELSRRVYAKNHRYSTIEELYDSICAHWIDIDLPVTRNLIDSMENRIYEVILMKGGHTDY